MKIASYLILFKNVAVSKKKALFEKTKAKQKKLKCNCCFSFQ